MLHSSEVSTLSDSSDHLLSRSSGADRPRHSFPTRRSSDLTSAERLASLVPHRQQDRQKPRRRCSPPGLICAVRSEEHTSELQSRGHLVCRPLLEKKNKTHSHNQHTQRR